MISLNNTKRLLFFFVLKIFLFVNYIHSKNNLIDLKELKDGIWYFKPEQHQINKKNQGLIANLGVIIGEKKIMVIDSGSTRNHAKKFISEIEKISKKPIKYLVITHRHFDHSFGINEFININAEIFFDEKEFLYFYKEGPRIKKMLTNSKILNKDSINFNKIEKKHITFLKDEKIINLGNRKVLIKNIGEAHSAGDIIVYDFNTKTYFSGDVVFKERAAAFSDSNIKKWLKKINLKFDKEWDYMIPGHGSLIFNKSGLDDTVNWLNYLDSQINKAVEQGDLLAEILDYPIPKNILHLKLIKETMRQGIKNQLVKYNLKKLLNKN